MIGPHGDFLLRAQKQHSLHDNYLYPQVDREEATPQYCDAQRMDLPGLLSEGEDQLENHNIQSP